MKKMFTNTNYIMNCKGLLFCLFSLGLTFNGISQSTCFSSANDNVFEGPGNSRCITKGDFDNDGDIDVVMGNYTGAPDGTIQRLYFLENDGNAFFSAPVSISSGSQPLDVQSADLDNDGNLDLVVVNFNFQRMAVMLGNGDGTFQAPVGYASDFGPNKITLEDFDGDGFTDVAITTNANTVNVFMNDSGSPGSFLAFTGFALNGGANPSGIYSGDLDNDGNIDLVTANNGNGNASVLNGDGTGSFAAPVDYVTGTGCYSVVLGDMDGDTNLDIVTVNEDDDNVSILTNDGSGNFSAPANFPAGDGPMTLRIDDFDNDLNLDVVAVNSQDNTLSVLLGNGDGTLQVQSVVGAINSPRNLITGDFNGDSNSDVIISCLIGQVMPVYLGDGTGVFENGNSFPAGNDPNSIYSADFNNDGNEDIVVVNSADNTATVHHGDGSGEADLFVLGTTLNTGNNPTSVVGADLDNDGFEDIIVTNYADDNVSVFMNSAGGFGAPTTFNSSATPIRIKKGDINNDGDPDIIVLNENNQLSVLIGDGAGGLSAPTTHATGNVPLGIDVGDVNNDNFDDVVVANSADDNVSIYTNDGTGNLGAPVIKNVGDGPNSVTFGDLNNDGAPEIVTTNFTSNNISVYANNGSGLFGFAATNYTSSDSDPLDAVIEDFDGDGNNDVAVANRVSPASTGNVAIFVGDGANGLTFDQRYGTGMDPVGIVSNDFNNDGLPDLSTVNFASNNVSILLNFSGTPTITALGPTTFCSGGSVDLESTPAPNYYWSNGETTQVITVTTTGTYEVETSTGIGGWCSSVSNSIDVDVTSGPTLSFTGDTDICVGESTTLTVSGATTYTWSHSLGTGDTKTVSPGSTTTYTVTGDDGSACTTDLDITVTVNPLPDADFTGLDPEYCSTAPSVTLVPDQSGGTFSGPGVSGNEFDPGTAGIGTHIITYNITDANGCDNSSNQSVDVTSGTIDSDFTGLDPDYCLEDGIATLTPNTSGGTFSGPGISGNDFDPSVAGVGVHTITYEVTSGGCTGSTDKIVEVNAMPDSDFTGLDPEYCLNDATVTLVPNEPGGTFSGPGMTGDDFNPSDAGDGIHTITYE
ncbi:MAG: FG-GAP-like repeat-containing protein, partial [Brumimicrobium sp.]